MLQINDGAQGKNKDLTNKSTPSKQDVSSAPFPCTDCGKKFFYEKSLTLHRQTIHTENILNSPNPLQTDSGLKISCPISQTGSGSKLSSPISQTDSGSKLSCPICHGCLSTEFQMNQHIRLCHPNSETDIKDRKSNPNYLIQSEFVCEYCNMDLISKQRLEQHIKSHHENASKGKNANNAKTTAKSCPKTCFHCNKTFCSRSSLLVHKMNFHSKNLHTGNYPYTCKLCNKGFDRKLSLVTHVRFHPEMRNKNNTSSSNSKGAKSSSNTTESKKYTKRDSLYFCNFCLQSNPSESAMQSHIQEFHSAGPSSSNAKPGDTATLTTQQTGKRKQKFIQNEVTPSKMKLDSKSIKTLSASLQDFTRCSSGKYKCNICGKVLNSSNGIDYHLHKHILGESIKIDTQHYTKKDSNYVCNFCDKTLVTAVGIQYHIRHSHLKLHS